MKNFCIFTGLVIAASSLAYGTDWSVSTDTGTLQKYNSINGALLATIAIGFSYPQGIAFGPDGNVYVADQFSRRVLKYDANTGGFLGIFIGSDDALALSQGLSGPTGLIFGPDGNLYVSSSDFGDVLEYDGKT